MNQPPKKQTPQKSRKEQKTGEQLIQELTRGEPLAPIYYINGDNPYLIRQLIEMISERIQPAFRDFNLHQVTGGEASGEQISTLAQQLPFMDSQCVVLVREASQLTKRDLEQLQNYLVDPSPTTCLALINPSIEIAFDGRTTSGKILQDSQILCKKPYDNHITQWIKQRSNHHNINLSFDAAARLFDLLGNDLTALDNALQRISLFIGGKGEISIDIINQVIEGDREYNIFDLVKFVSMRQFEQALRYMRGALQQGESPIRLVGLLARTFQKLLSARAIFEQGERSFAAYDSFIHFALRSNRQQFIREFLAQVKRFTLRELLQAMRLLHQADLSLKSTSAIAPELIMENLLLELAIPKRPK
jgi:DNA polymerase-3 subunit delta